jgi:hypothetical protein
MFCSVNLFSGSPVVRNFGYAGSIILQQKLSIRLRITYACSI